MRAARHLGRLHFAAQHRLEKLSNLFLASISLPAPQRSVQLSYITVELDNLNICVLREFTVSTLRGAKSLSGNVIQVNGSFGAEGEIGAYILSVQNNVLYLKKRSPVTVVRTDEPTIRDPKETEKILVNCAASNLPSLQNALALNSNMFRDVKFIRHFYAHRSKDTFAKASTNAARMGIYNLNHPDDILLFRSASSSLTVLEDWLADAKIFYELLMQ